MYKIKNGILEENGKKIFAVGESYYPSFYPYKYPVPPEGDRVGEMKKDFAMMKSLGFNYVRIAAIGTVKLSEDGSLAVDTPFVGKLLKEAERVGLSISVRLQGYSVKLRDFKDVCMIDADGKPQDLSVCYDFIQKTLCHGGNFGGQPIFVGKTLQVLCKIQERCGISDLQRTALSGYGNFRLPPHRHCLIPQMACCARRN